MAHSIEEHVELTAKQQLQQAGVDFKFKTDNVNDEVEAALSKAESKSGGKGKNIPDIKILLQMPHSRWTCNTIRTRSRQMARTIRVGFGEMVTG